MVRAVVPILALGAAAMAATVLGSLAHDGLGIHRDTIRIDALAIAAFIGFALAGSTLLSRNK
jgi:Na+-driven multidrug efflux pump